MSEYSLKVSEGTLFRKCHICKKDTISIPLHIIHESGDSLCTICSEKYMPALHESLHLYLDKYRHYQRKFQSRNGIMYSMMISLNFSIEEVDDFFTTLAIDLCIIFDEYDIESLYMFPQGEIPPIGKISYRSESDKHTDVLAGNIFEALTHQYKKEVNSLLVMDEKLLDFDREWNMVFPSKNVPAF